MDGWRRAIPTHAGLHQEPQPAQRLRAVFQPMDGGGDGERGAHAMLPGGHDDEQIYGGPRANLRHRRGHQGTHASGTHGLSTAAAGAGTSRSRRMES